MFPLKRYQISLSTKKNVTSTPEQKQLSIVIALGTNIRSEFRSNENFIWLCVWVFIVAENNRGNVLYLFIYLEYFFFVNVHLAIYLLKFSILVIFVTIELLSFNGFFFFFVIFSLFNKER